MVEGIEHLAPTRPAGIVPLDNTRPASFLKGQRGAKNFGKSGSRGLAPLVPSGDSSAPGLGVGVIGRTHQRRRGDVGEAQGFAEYAQMLEFLRRRVALHR